MFDSLLVEASTLTIRDVLTRILLAFVLGLATALLYRKTHNSPSCSRSFMNTLAMLSMVTCMVLIVIGNNVARAFTLVGALSIIRFRTAVKDTRDTAFVFLALAAGMAAGTTRPSLVIAIYCGVGVLVYLLHGIPLGRSSNGTVGLRFSVQPDEIPEDVYLSVIKSHARTISLVGLQSQKLGQLMELSYQLEMRRTSSAQNLVSRLSALPGVMKVAILSLDQQEEP